MSHDLDFTKGEAAIAYVGATPWHGYGEQLTEDATIDEWIIAAGLDYNVLKRPTVAMLEDGSELNLPNYRTLVRDDTNGALAVVSNRFKVVQPKEIVYFFESLVNELGFKLDVAGALADGKRVWATARTPEGFTLGGIDRVDAYLLLATSYDGKFATTGTYTGIRTVCNNTLSMALEHADEKASAGSSHVFKVSHLSDFDPDIVKMNLGLLEDQVTRFRAMAEELTQLPVTREEAIQFYMNLMGHFEEDPNDANAEQIYTVKKLLESYTQSPGADMKTAHNTGWGLLNGVTHFTDHARRARDNGTRMNSAWFGSGAQLKRQALAALNKWVAAFKKGLV